MVRLTPEEHSLPQAPAPRAKGADARSASATTEALPHKIDGRQSEGLDCRQFAEPQPPQRDGRPCTIAIRGSLRIDCRPGFRILRDQSASVGAGIGELTPVNVMPIRCAYC